MLLHRGFLNLRFFDFGAALVSSILQALQALTYLLLAVTDAECRQCWPGINSSALRGWCAYLKIAVPCFVMGVCEWWSWDIVNFLAGLCPEPKTALAVPEKGAFASAI